MEPSAPPRPADLRESTAVRAVPKIPGLWLAELDDRWNYFNPCGGVLMTIALRAMCEELADPQLQLVSATTVFCQAVLPGPMQITVTVLRRGDTAAQVRARLDAVAQPGPGLEVLATFARSRPGPDVTGVAMPACARPSARLGARTGGARFRIFENIELSPAFGDPMWGPDDTEDPAHVGYWYRYERPQVLPSGALDPLAIPPLADSMPPALVRKLGPKAPRLLMPSLDLTVYFLGTVVSEWVMVESFVERARDGYAVGSANLWAEDGTLVARAAQAMTLRERKR
jgi:hypothetical protein